MKHKSFRMNSRTIDQLLKLAERYNESQTAVVRHLIDDRYMKEIKEMDSREIAQRRVWKTPELEPYEEWFIHDWDEGDEHFDWVATAPVEKLVAWAETVSSQE